jgi:tetratricopeptide (TPR) repeat protein
MRLAAWAVGLTLIMGMAAGAAAQAPAPAPAPAIGSPDAKEAFRRGEAAYSAGNYEVAIREWKSAYATDPRPRIQFNLSQAYERMGQLENAIQALETFLNSGDPDDPTYSDANARLVALRQRLESTGVIVNGGAEGGLILVDDKDWGRTPRPDKITVAPGGHVIVVRWPDGSEFRTSVVVPAGQSVEVNVPAEGGSRPAPGMSPGPAPAAPAKDRRVLWYSLGGGTAAVGVGLLAYGLARHAEVKDCDDSNASGTVYCNPDQEDKAYTQRNTGLAIGSILIAGGAALFVVGALTHKKSDKMANTQCGIGLASAACRFRF